MITTALRLLAVALGSCAVCAHAVGALLDGGVKLLRKTADVSARVEGHLWTLGLVYGVYRGYLLWVQVQEAMNMNRVQKLLYWLNTSEEQPFVARPGA